jgi:hypothetical protein
MNDTKQTQNNSRLTLFFIVVEPARFQLFRFPNISDTQSGHTILYIYSSVLLPDNPRSWKAFYVKCISVHSLLSLITCWFEVFFVTFYHKQLVQSCFDYLFSLIMWARTNWLYHIQGKIT